MRISSLLRRTAPVIAGAGALAVVAAGPASAHHCLKEWNDAARAQVSSGTSWLPMSDFVYLAVTEFIPGLGANCGDHADEFTAAWMEYRGIETEPTIHMKATTGGGAVHHSGKEPKPFNYLGDNDFMFLEGLIAEEPDCVPPPVD